MTETINKIRKMKWIYALTVVGLTLEAICLGLFIRRLDNPAQYKDLLSAIGYVNRAIMMGVTAWYGHKIGFSQQKAWGFAFVAFFLNIIIVMIPLVVYLLLQKPKLIEPKGA